MYNIVYRAARTDSYIFGSGQTKQLSIFPEIIARTDSYIPDKKEKYIPLVL
jgi:hypothetical protein